MLKRILLYSFAAIFLGIVVMLLPLILYLPMLASTIMQQALPATEESEKASFNVTNVKRTLSLSEAAQIYGKNDIAVGGEGSCCFLPTKYIDSSPTCGFSWTSCSSSGQNHCRRKIRVTIRELSYNQPPNLIFLFTHNCLFPDLPYLNSSLRETPI